MICQVDSQIQHAASKSFSNLARGKLAGPLKIKWLDLWRGGGASTSGWPDRALCSRRSISAW